VPSSLIPLCTPIDANRVLDAAWLLLPGGLPRSGSDGYRIRLGTTDAAGKSSWFSTFDTHQQSIPEAGVVKVTGAARMARRLAVGGSVLAEVVPYGAPVLPAALCAQILVSPTARIPAHRVHDAAMRDATDGLSEYVQGVGAGEQWIVKTLADAVGDYVTTSHTASAQTIVAGGAYENGTVSATATKPAWARVGRVEVTVDMSVFGIAGTGNCFLAIGDGSAEQTGEQYFSSLTTQRDAASLTYRGDIRATTTFVPRFKSDTNNVSVIRQTISLRVTWT